MSDGYACSRSDAYSVGSDSAGPWSSPDERGFGLVSGSILLQVFQKALWLIAGPDVGLLMNWPIAKLDPMQS